MTVTLALHLVVWCGALWALYAAGLAWHERRWRVRDARRRGRAARAAQDEHNHRVVRDRKLARASIADYSWVTDDGRWQPMFVALLDGEVLLVSDSSAELDLRIAAAMTTASRARRGC